MKSDREIKVRCSACGHLTRIPTVTNADRIRAMTDEELAYFIAECVVECPALSDCTAENFCEGAWLAWLKKEVDNG